MTDQVTSIILFDGFPLVLISHNRFMTGHQLLDWYSEKYDIERSKLRLVPNMDTVQGPQESP